MENENIELHMTNLIFYDVCECEVFDIFLF